MIGIVTAAKSHSENSPHPPARRSSVRELLAYAALLGALISLVCFHLASDVFSGSSPGQWDQYDDIHAEIARTSISQQNIELHLDDPEAGASEIQIRFMRIYYAAAYICYPKVVYVGTNDRIFKSADVLVAADKLPSQQWLHEHHVSSVYSVYGLGLIPHISVSAVP